jgi:PPK2 family polyphosphate:nucleotide phosphotransferase
MPTLHPHPEGKRLRLTDDLAAPPDGLHGKGGLDEALESHAARLAALQAALGAEGTRALLIVLQGRDACGKDGTVRRVFSGLNPAYAGVTSFKRPSALELRHDYLWRIHQAVPARGTIGIFNRSHYEDVLTVRVHGLVPEPVWRRRYEQINAFERMLADEGTVIRKFFLHVSKEEQRKRLEERLDDPAKNWKFEPGDLQERARWDDYTAAYEEMLERCSTAWAPWYVVPADRNKPRDFLVAEAVVAALEEMNPRYPEADPAVLKMRGKIV